MKIKIFNFIVVSFIISCNENLERNYYETGELLSEIKIINDSTKSVKEYYRNGNLHWKSFMINSEPNGYAEEYFEDGVLKWKGNFKDGIVEYKYIEDSILYKKNRSFIQTPKLKKIIRVGDTCKFRTYVEGIHPEHYLVDITNIAYISKNEDDYYMYPHVIIARDTGDLYLYLYFGNEEGKYVIGERTLKYFLFHVYPKIE